jgi:hypothetical protein
MAMPAAGAGGAGGPCCEARGLGRNLKPEAVYALVRLAVIWQIISYFVPNYLFRPCRRSPSGSSKS